MSRHNGNPVVLITGITEGLGRALAQALLVKGWHVIGDGRNGTALRDTWASAVGPRLTVVPGDICEAGHRTQLRQTGAEAGGFDAVVLNAGTLGAAPRPALLNYPLPAARDVFETNVLAQLSLLQVLAPDFHPGVKLIGITSDVAVLPCAGWGVYAASKAALDMALMVAAAENPQWSVYVTDPGEMATAMHRRAFPDLAVADIPAPPEDSVPGLVDLLHGDWPSGRYEAKALPAAAGERRR